jgi:hypothetical protein
MEEGDAAATWDPLVSDRKREEGAAAAAHGPAQARARKGKLGLDLAGPPGRKGEKVSLFYFFFFLFFICLFSNYLKRFKIPKQIK